MIDSNKLLLASNDDGDNDARALLFPPSSRWRLVSTSSCTVCSIENSRRGKASSHPHNSRLLISIELYRTVQSIEIPKFRSFIDLLRSNGPSLLLLSFFVHLLAGRFRCYYHSPMYAATSTAIYLYLRNLRVLLS